MKEEMSSPTAEIAEVRVLQRELHQLQNKWPEEAPAHFLARLKHFFDEYQPSEAKTKAPPQFSELRVLVIDGDGINRKVAHMLLSSLGIKVKVAGSDNSGFAAATCNDFDLILCELAQPEHNTLNRIISLRENLLQRQKSPLIFAYSAGHTLEPRRLLEYFDASLDKPLQLNQLISLLQRFF